MQYAAVKHSNIDSMFHARKLPVFSWKNYLQDFECLTANLKRSLLTMDASHIKTYSIINTIVTSEKEKQTLTAYYCTSNGIDIKLKLFCKLTNSIQNCSSQNCFHSVLCMFSSFHLPFCVFHLEKRQQQPYTNDITISNRINWA